MKNEYSVRVESQATGVQEGKLNFVQGGLGFYDLRSVASGVAVGVAFGAIGALVHEATRKPGSSFMTPYGFISNVFIDKSKITLVLNDGGSYSFRVVGEGIGVKKNAEAAGMIANFIMSSAQYARGGV